MILTKKILDLLSNSPKIKEIYPMLKKVETEVNWDGDTELPSYVIQLDFYLNDPKISSWKDMFQKKFDPHYLIDHHLSNMFKMIGMKRGEISQIYIKVFNGKGKIIFGGDDDLF